MQECPHCGSAMRLCRLDRQQVGERTLVLHWLICERCRHVLLGRWEDLTAEEMPAAENERVIHLLRFSRPGRNGRSG